jgi:hypothetical protein
MKPDFYTKSVLTVIAFCLVILVCKQVDVVPKAYAEMPKHLPANMSYGLVPVNADGSINVNIKSTTATMDVNIDEVGGYSTYGTLEVKVK